jgi:exocyst complex component 3
VQRLLQGAEDLKRLDALREDYASKLCANKMQLAASVASQAESARAGLADVAAAHSALVRLRSNLALIQSLCAECQSLIDCNERIQSLAAAHRNLRKALQDMEAVAALPAQARRAEALLDGDAGLLRSYERLACLQGTAMQVRRALGGGTGDTMAAAKKYGTEGFNGLESYFSRVDIAMARFEERLWSTVRNFHSVAKKTPALLVAAAQVIEAQEAADVELLAAGHDTSPLLKGWRHRCSQQISMSCQDRFAPLLQRCSRLAASPADIAAAAAVNGSDADSGVEALLSEADGFVAHLSEVRDLVVPCFPPSYQIFGVVCAEYHRQLGAMLDFIGVCAANLSNGEILRVLGWAARYQEVLGSLGVDDEDAELEDGPISGVALLVEKYGERTGATLSSWVANIVEADLRPDRPPRFTSEGRAWIPGSVEFFRMLHEQAEVAAQSGSPVLLAQAWRQAAQAMISYCGAQADRIAACGLPLETLCAVANDGARCHAQGLAFCDGLLAGSGGIGRAVATAALDVRTLRVELDTGCAGFLRLSSEAVAACVAAVVADPGLASDLFPRLCCSDDWRGGIIAGSVLATLEDFLRDLRAWLEPRFLVPLAEGLLAQTVAHYLAATLTLLRSASTEEVSVVLKDAARISGFFERYLGGEKASAAIQPLHEICDFMTASGVDSFVLSYGALLASAPGVAPALLSGVLAARVAADPAFAKSDAREALEACRAVHAERVASAGAASQPAAAGARGRVWGAKDSAYRAAVMACLAR